MDETKIKIPGFSQSRLSSDNCKAYFDLNDCGSIYVNIFSKSDIPVGIFLFIVKS